MEQIGRSKSVKHSQLLILAHADIPVTLDISYVQDGIGVARPQTQRLIDNIVYLHVASSARRTHQKPNREAQHTEL